MYSQQAGPLRRAIHHPPVDRMLRSPDVAKDKEKRRIRRRAEPPPIERKERMEE